MKRLLCALLVLIMLFLSACGQAGEPEEITEASAAATLAAASNAASVTFLSKVYTAPASYEGAPPAYKPVLDAVYLYEQIRRPCNNLNWQGEMTANAWEEYDGIIENLFKKFATDAGYDKYDNLYYRERNKVGYAVKDINNDGTPELLLLEKDRDLWPYPKRNAPYAMFTIRNGKAVRVEGDIGCLAEDGFTYNVNYNRINLTSFKLEPGATELTCLSIYGARLAFWEDEDIPPQPYWYKEDLERPEEDEMRKLLITEEEYETVAKQYENPSWMTFDFIPMDDMPDEAYTHPVTTEAPKLKPTVNYPSSYKSAPKAYKPILDDLYKCAQLIFRDDCDQIDWDYIYGETNFGERPLGQLGYMLVDINKDGIAELMLMSGQPEDDTFLWSLFVLKDNKPVHILSNSPVSRCTWYFTMDGTFYQVGNGGSFSTFVSSWKLKPGAAELTELTDYWCDSSLRFYCSHINGKKEYITKKEFEAMHEKYSNPPNQMEFTFIPIEQ